MPAADEDITPLTSSKLEPQDQPKPQDQPLSSSIPPLPHSTPQIPSDILDIGKLLELGIDIKKISREHIYRILTAEPCVEPSAYPRTPAYPGSNIYASVSAFLVQAISLAPLQLSFRWCLLQVLRNVCTR